MKHNFTGINLSLQRKNRVENVKLRSPPEGGGGRSPQKLLFRNPPLKKGAPLPQAPSFFIFFSPLIFWGGRVEGVDLFLRLTPFPTLTFLQPASHRARRFPVICLNCRYLIDFFSCRAEVAGLSLRGCAHGAASPAARLPPESVGFFLRARGRAGAGGRLSSSSWLWRGGDPRRRL